MTRSLESLNVRLSRLQQIHADLVRKRAALTFAKGGPMDRGRPSRKDRLSKTMEKKM